MLPHEDVNLFDFNVDLSLLSDDDLIVVNQAVPLEEPPNSSPESGGSLSIGEIEHLLMEDDDNHEGQMFDFDFSDDFLSDILLDAPAESDRSGGVIDELPENTSSNSSEAEADVEEEDNDEDEEKQKVDVVPQDENQNGDGDPISKKRKRQLRNRDAAMRSRERRKMYVRDLEMKSRYLEGECKRLGMLLQCCFAENQALRLSLQNAKAVDATRNCKQESAVLLLESLLLGSLLWFLGIVCLLIPFRLPKSGLEGTPPENVGNKNQGNLLPRKAGSDLIFLQVIQSFIMTRRCKASRSRMKPSLVAASALMSLFT